MLTIGFLIFNGAFMYKYLYRHGSKSALCAKQCYQTLLESPQAPELGPPLVQYCINTQGNAALKKHV